jgi:hypothetical protein
MRLFATAEKFCATILETKKTNSSIRKNNFFLKVLLLSKFISVTDI